MGGGTKQKMSPWKQDLPAGGSIKFLVMAVQDIPVLAKIHATDAKPQTQQSHHFSSVCLKFNLLWRKYPKGKVSLSWLILRAGP